MGRLSGADLEALHTALLEAFPTQRDLEQLLRFKLDMALGKIAGQGSHSHGIFDVLEWAEREDKLARPIQGALDQSDNPTLEAVAPQLQARLRE